MIEIFREFLFYNDRINFVLVVEFITIKNLVILLLNILNIDPSIKIKIGLLCYYQKDKSEL